MERRENLVEQFSTFLFWGDENVRWVSDGRLQRRMENYLAQGESLTNPEYWVLFFQKKWLSSGKGDNPFRQHLHAYLQEPCYWAADKMYQNYHQKFEYAKEDYFNMGVLLFDNEILSEFNPQLNTRFYNFALTRLKQRITDQLREEDRTVGHTIWSLLLNQCSPRRLTKALSLQGLSGEFLESHLLAWNYYQEIYGQARRRIDGRLQPPSHEQWAEIAQKYNSDSESTLKVSPQEIEEWLETCGNALLNYLSPTGNEVELDKPIGEDGDTIEDLTEAPTQGNLIDILGEKEEWESTQQTMRKILAWLQEEIPKIKPERQSEMEMRYGEKLTWQDIAVRLGKKRKDYTPILRRVQTVRKNLAKKFIEWAKKNLHTPLKSDDIETMSETLELWLEHYYQNTNNH
jgi:hypothetical protein